MNLKAKRASSTELDAAAIMLHIYFDLRTYALGRLVKRLLGARASERQWPHLRRVFRFAIVSFVLFPSSISSYSLHSVAPVVHTRILRVSHAAIKKKKNVIFRRFENERTPADNTPEVVFRVRVVGEQFANNVF